jgi:hypothetical protein
MSDYSPAGNIYTAIFVDNSDGTFTRAPFNIVRFNDEKTRWLVPVEIDSGKTFERIWIVKELPWQRKVGFDGVH